MHFDLNLCTSVLPKFSFDNMVEVAIQAEYKGVELRVDENYHKSLSELSDRGVLIKQELERAGLQIEVLSSYIPVEDECNVNLLLNCARVMGVPKSRIVLPRSCNASVFRHANISEVIPSYESRCKPIELIDKLRRILTCLEDKARRAGIQFLLELHWGTVMSSFSSAYLLIQDLDPDYIGITFDPANMMVEGKEDWEFGLKLILPYVANVHIKNVAWMLGQRSWQWKWAPLSSGMVDWIEIILLLTRNNYRGSYAIEDFLATNYSKQEAIKYLSSVKYEFIELYRQFHQPFEYPYYSGKL